jgi:hypothetical protein
MVSNEAGEVQERTDTFITGHHNDFTLQWLIRARDSERTDQQLNFDVHHRVSPRFGFNAGAHVSTRGTMLPQNGVYVAPYVVTGRFVFTPGLHYQNFKQDEDLVLGSLNVDYYFSNYRLGARQLLAFDHTEVNATTISFQHIGDVMNWTLYVSDGNEVLDIPFYYGDNRVGGGILRVRMDDAFDLIFGGNIGQRNEQAYITGTIGVRANF